MSSPKEIRNNIAAAIKEAVMDLWGDLVPQDYTATVSVSKNLECGDISSTDAMVLARIIRKNPRESAQMIVDYINDSIEEISEITVNGPGFINFTFSSDYLGNVAVLLAENGILPLLPHTGTGRRVLVEFVSSNPTGPLTVGHCRQAVLGDTICRLLETAGWDVSREYYFNDAGRQVRFLGESLHARYSELNGLGCDIPEGGYNGKYVIDWAEELAKEKGRKLTWENDSGIFISFAGEKAMEMIQSDLNLLNIRFDRYFSESELIPDSVEEAVSLLAEKNLIYADAETPSKKWLRFTELGRPEDKVIKRENGEYTYRMPDIAYHLDKFRRGYDRIIDIFGSDHIDTSRDVRAAVSILLGEDEVEEKLDVIIHQFVTLLRDGKKVKMSTRAGEFVTLLDLVSEVDSVDVTRYLFLAKRAEAHVDFDIDLAREESGENPVFYIQYAFARISGLLKTAADTGIGLKEFKARELTSFLTGEHERELMRLLETVPGVLSGAIESLEPHRLTELLANLAAGFHRYYQHVRIVDAEEPDISCARLLLCKACKRCISELLFILGVESPEEM